MKRLFLCVQYFQDDKKEWHQPGTRAEFDDDEADGLIERGCIIESEVQQRKPPADRMVHFNRGKGPK